jgi:3-hydroxyisobutyrate dehydrogenase
VTDTRVAVMGLGGMGSGMAANLLRAGFPVAVYNRHTPKAALLADKGARLAASPRDAADGADVVISMVADDIASRAVWMGEHGALAAAKRGAVLIESSTLSVGWIEALAAAARAGGAELLDAPVTGSRDHAAAGQLLFLVGGSADALERPRPVLTPMSRGIVHVGNTGAGALLKLINNFMCGVEAAVLAEAVTMVERSGLNPATALDVLVNGAAGSPLVKTVTPRMTGKDYTPPYFALKLMAKDLNYAREEAARRGVTLETASCALGLFERALAAGQGDRDFAAIVEPKRARPS